MLALVAKQVLVCRLFRSLAAHCRARCKRSVVCNTAGIRAALCPYHLAPRAYSACQVPVVLPGTLALGCLSSSSRVRRAAASVASHAVFEAVVLVAIVANCVLLAMDGPGVAPSSRLRAVLDVADAVFAGVFVAEAALKLAAWGAWGCGRWYVPSLWTSGLCLWSTSGCTWGLAWQLALCMTLRPGLEGRSRVLACAGMGNG